MARARRPLEERFLEKVQRSGPDDCWNWTSCRSPDGYGIVRIATGKGNERAHRFAWRMNFGSIPDGYYVRQKCENHACCNPSHLYLNVGGNDADKWEGKFKAKIKTGGPDECWLWMGIRNGQGYGMTMDKWTPEHKGKLRGAHCIAYELVHGKIPKGLYICHKCDNPPCVNPAHLFLGTPSDNQRDCQSKNRNKKGEQNHSAKLTEETVRELRSLYVPYSKTFGTQGLARKFGVSSRSVLSVVKKETWKHVA